MARAAARALIVIVWLEKRPGIVICCLVLKLIVCVCVIKIIIINDSVDVKGDPLVGYASQDCDLLPGIKDAF